MAASALAFVPLMALAQILAQRVPFSPVLIVSDRRQILWIGVYYLIYAVPFFFGAVFINATFVIHSDRIHRLYFWNMAGSGLGGLLVLGFMVLLPPELLTVPLIILAAGGAALCLVEENAGRLVVAPERIVLSAPVPTTSRR